ncbi:MAG: transposase [Syntrophaceae bacterium]|nr:transposase [Syntrophaceae bacterium]
MNRGYDGRAIFREDGDKRIFLELLKKSWKLLKIRIFAYCLIDNHYHLVLQNMSGRMPQFFKRLNGQYGNYYRNRYGGKGYVFQERYKSMLIQDDAYVMSAIAYVLTALR